MPRRPEISRWLSRHWPFLIVAAFLSLVAALALLPDGDPWDAYLPYTGKADDYWMEQGGRV